MLKRWSLDLHLFISLDNVLFVLQCRLPCIGLCKTRGRGNYSLFAGQNKRPVKPLGDEEGKGNYSLIAGYTGQLLLRLLNGAIEIRFRLCESLLDSLGGAGAGALGRVKVGRWVQFQAVHD